MATKNSLAERIAQLDARKKTLLARQAKLERTQDTRRKVLLGALILHRIEHDKENGARMKAWVAKELPGFLTRDTDKELFPDLLDSTVVDHAKEEPGPQH